MKKAVLLVFVILFTLNMGKAQKTWAYENQKNKKGSITGGFSYQGGKSWIEKNNIEGPFAFEEYKKTESYLILFDKNRNVYVKLTQNEMFASWGTDNKWEKYYTGQWKSWTYENQDHSKGKISGQFTYLGGNKWIEKNDIEGPFNFEEYQISETEVILHDKDRNVYVKLTPTEMYASWNEPDNWEKYYEGSWK